MKVVSVRTLKLYQHNCVWKKTGFSGFLKEGQLPVTGHSKYLQWDVECQADKGEEVPRPERQKEVGRCVEAGSSSA